ncbi:hypothetical protein A9Q81_17630 [Gammaproteobacteria bacterium 42_54_T18]|nr:hypothetical protein A9Q81_17630 [Gammaproteobacteria bacterium 42_54_T18]
MLLCFIFFSGYLPAPLQSQENKTLQIRTISISPYGIISEGKFSGIYYDLANTLARETGYKVSHGVYPYARIIHELKYGKTDLTIMFKYKELEDHVTYIAPLPSLKNVVIGLKGSHFPNIRSLKDKNIAYLRGAKFSDKIDSDTNISKTSIRDFDQGINMLLAKRVDAIIGPLDPIMVAFNKLNITGDHAKSTLGSPLIVSERTPWVQLSKHSKSGISINKLTEHFQHILERGELERLRQHYMTP